MMRAQFPGDECLPCAYVLLSHKTGESNEELRQAVVDRCAALGFDPDPTRVVTDFRKASVDARHSILRKQGTVHDCFFLFTKST